MYATIGLIIFMWAPAIIVLVRNVSHHTYIWQIKEYRVDRIISQIKYDEERSLKSNWINTFQVLLLVGSIIFFIHPMSLLLLIPALTLISYTIESMQSIEGAILGKFIRPKRSIRNLLILGLSFFTILLPIILPINFTKNIYEDPAFENATIAIENQTVKIEDFLVQRRIEESNAEGISLALAIVMLSSAIILISDLASPFVVSFFAIITEPLAQYKRLKMIYSAKAKTLNHKGFKVVGITGSYGKTTTKELLYYLIKDNFKTAITDKNYNSTVGIAQSVLNNLEPQTEIFIAEMGAYRKGEIKNSCKILQPDIAIVTGLIEQHISLFGNIEKLFATKFEIIQALKDSGLAIFNGNNRLSLQMAGKTDHRKVTYGIIEKEIGDEGNNSESNKNEYLKDGKIEGEIYAKNLVKTDNGFKFDLKFKTTSYPISIKLQGKHNIENLLACIASALELGMPIKDIVAKLNSTEPPQVYLRAFNGFNEALILDDSYNSNSLGFKKALIELKDLHGKRRIVLSKGIIELGKERDKVYQDIAKEFQGIDVLITTDRKLAEWAQAANTEIIIVKDNFELYTKTLAEIKENDLVLLEGALPEKIINTLIEPNN